MPHRSEPQALHAWLAPQLPKMLRTLGKFVRAESPSTEKHAADACARIIALEWRKRDVRVELLEQKHRGAHLRVTRTSDDAKSRGQILVLGHYDTVYSTGTLAKMPFRVAAGRAFGPGAFDMKAGIAFFLFASLDYLRILISQ